jgi:glycosyltransferase involved in cell wall biosynthesis
MKEILSFIMIHVVFIVRSTLFIVKGGDTIQVTETAKNLHKLGIEVDIKLTHETIDYESYDLLHFFNITRPADILYHVRKTKKPFVLSTILIDYSEFDKYHRKGFAGLLFHFLYRDSLEYIKTIARMLKGKDKLMTVSYLWKGQKKTVREILNKTSMLLPNSKLEYQKLNQYSNCLPQFTLVPNGVDPERFKLNGAAEKNKNLVLCVARIEGIKNQINLIRALNHSGYQLFIIGSPAPNQIAYYEECRQIAASNILFINDLTQDELVKFYQLASVHVLPSWFETCGLSSLEACVMGCNIVITDRGYTREYYEDHAYYCEPGSPESILNAVRRAASAPFPKELRNKILSSYTWLKAASVTANAYHKLFA